MCDKITSDISLNGIAERKKNMARKANKKLIAFLMAAVMLLTVFVQTGCGETPAEIALAVVAEILAVKNGRNGGFLKI